MSQESSLHLPLVSHDRLSITPSASETVASGGYYDEMNENRPVDTDSGPVESDLLQIEESDAELHEAIHDSKFQVLGNDALYFPPNLGLQARFRHLFPDARSRLAAAILIVTTVALTLTWSAITIRSKWIEPYSNPSTTITIEPVLQLPAAHGLLSFFHSDTWFNGTLADTLDDTFYNMSEIPINTPLPTYAVPNPIPSDRYLWHTYHLLGAVQESVNQTQVDQDYFCISRPKTGIEITPVSWCTARNYTTIFEQNLEWPLAYGSTLSQFCVRTYTLLDPRATVSVVLDAATSFSVNFNEFQYREPNYKFSIISLKDAYTVFKEYTETGGVDGQEFAGLYTDLVTLPYQHSHDISVKMSKRVMLDGTVDWRSEINFGGTHRLKNATITKAFDAFYAANPSLYQRLQQDPNIELNRSAWNFTQQYYAETCLGPTSFEIQVVTESTSYGFTNFLSDLGGALNILAVFLTLLFPLSHTFIQPRTFILIWLKSHWQRCRRQKAKQRLDVKNGHIQESPV